MCDYSLHRYRNRLAQEGETLVLHRFSSGCQGFVSVVQEPLRAKLKGRLVDLLGKFVGDTILNTEPCAICLPPGAVLQVTDEAGSSAWNPKIFLSAGDCVILTSDPLIE